MAQRSTPHASGPPYAGGCHCGSLRFAATLGPVDAGWCHCEICRRTTGAPALVWGSFPVGAFAYVKGTPTVYRSSARGQREFCAACGAQVAYREHGAAIVDVNVGCLDHPEGIEPRCHLWTASRIAWFETADALPRYAGAAPERPRA